MTETEIAEFVIDVCCFVAGHAYMLCEDQGFEVNQMGAK